MTTELKARPAGAALAHDSAQLSEIAADVLKYAKAQGASAAETEISEGVGQTVTVRCGEVETIEYNRDKGIGVSVYFGKRRGHARRRRLPRPWEHRSVDSDEQITEEVIEAAKARDDRLARVDLAAAVEAEVQSSRTVQVILQAAADDASAGGTDWPGGRTRASAWPSTSATAEALAATHSFSVAS